MIDNDIIEVQDGKRHYKQLDADFKRAVHNTDILSNVISKLVSELEDKDIEFIKGCVSPEEMPKVTGLNTEMHNDDDAYVIMDNLFSIDIPGEQGVGIMLNIEAQGDPEPGYPLLKRAIYYASGVMFNQKGTVFEGSHYEKLRKTYSIWFIMQPKPGNENTIVRYPLVKIPGLKKKKTIEEDCNLMEIIMVNLGGSEKTSNKTLKMFNEIFSSNVKGEMYRKRLQKKYNISVDDNTLESLERISMSLGEEIVNYQRRVGYNSGYESGYGSGYDSGYDSRKQEQIEQLASMAIGLMSQPNISKEKAIELALIPDDIKDEVIARIDQKLSE